MFVRSVLHVLNLKTQMSWIIRYELSGKKILFLKSTVIYVLDELEFNIAVTWYIKQTCESLSGCGNSAEDLCESKCVRMEDSYSSENVAG